ncbi:MAG: hypothetical protein WKG01_19205 [Kofleriaceae bacterium]
MTAGARAFEFLGKIKVAIAGPDGATAETSLPIPREAGEIALDKLFTAARRGQ